MFCNTNLLRCCFIVTVRNTHSVVALLVLLHKTTLSGETLQFLVHWAMNVPFLKHNTNLLIKLWLYCFWYIKEAYLWWLSCFLYITSINLWIYCFYYITLFAVTHLFQLHKTNLLVCYSIVSITQSNPHGCESTFSTK